MLGYLIEIDCDRCIILHLNTPLFGSVLTINDTDENYLFTDTDTKRQTDVAEIPISFNNCLFEMNFSNKFILFKDELKKIKGIDSIDINRFDILILKGKLFNWKNIINDIMHLLLCFYTRDGKAELIGFEIGKEAKKQISKIKRDLFKRQFPKSYNINS